jgi:hypothetical protein
MPPTTNYTPDLAGREPLGAVRRTAEQLDALVGRWTAEQFERTYAPGKWSARQILTHLAQTEMALGTRARMALSTPSYIAQSFSQDAWLVHDSRLTGPEATAAFLALSRMNAALFEGLTPDALAVTMSHPEYGAITVEWILYLLAGHQIQHVRQIEAIGAR